MILYYSFLRPGLALTIKWHRATKHQKAERKEHALAVAVPTRDSRSCRVAQKWIGLATVPRFRLLFFSLTLLLAQSGSCGPHPDGALGKREGGHQQLGFRIHEIYRKDQRILQGHEC